MTIHQLPDVGRIQGLVVQDSPLRDPLAMTVEVQYTGRTPPHEWHRVVMPMRSALYLLNLLEAMSREQGCDGLRRGSIDLQE